MERKEFRNHIESTRAEMCRYAGLRPALLKEHLSLDGTEGAPWEARCTRDVRPGAFKFTTVVDLPEDVAQNIVAIENSDISEAEKGLKRSSVLLEQFAITGAIALIENHDPLAPIIDFRLVNRDGNRPQGGTYIRQVELNLGLLLASTLEAVKGLHKSLLVVETYTSQHRVDADTSAITKFRLQLPDFPFVPPAAIGIAQRWSALAAEQKLIDDAIFSMERISIAVASHN